MVLVIDNYDSFTYNLVQAIGAILQMGNAERGLGSEKKGKNTPQSEFHNPHSEVLVLRNDKVTILQIEQMNPSHIIISPGPCTPKEGGISNDVIKHFSGRTPILGVCLGHQCIAYTYGAEVVRAGKLMHGKTSMIKHDGKTIFKGIQNPFEATRYHSLIVKEDTLPDCFEVSARADEDEVMGIRHKEFPLEGVQFHPESFLTKEGPKLLKNFLLANQKSKTKNQNDIPKSKN